MKIGNVTLSSNAVLAPMAGWGDLGFRYLARLYGAGLTYTEMISVCGLQYRNAQTELLLTTAPNETPAAVQLFGSRPELFAEAVRNPKLDKFAVIDINMGCPVHKVVGRGEGSALMKTPDLAAAIVQACVQNAGGRPVTVKMRLGWDSDTAVDFARRMQQAGASALAVHGRTRSQMYTGHADWQAIGRVVQAVSIPVFANGDVKTVDDYHAILACTGAEGVMIARGAVGNAALFARIAGKEPQVDYRRDFAAMVQQLSPLYEDRIVCNILKPHIINAVSGRAGARELRVAVGNAKCMADLQPVLEKL